MMEVENNVAEHFEGKSIFLDVDGNICGLLDGNIWPLLSHEDEEGSPLKSFLILNIYKVSLFRGLCCEWSL